MAQVSYGTITITDTNDIEEIYMVYAGADSNTISPDESDFNLWKRNINEITGNYIWQRAVVKKSGIIINAQNFTQYYGEAVCITGTGKGVGTVVTYYCNYGNGQPAETYSGWSLTVPEYDSTKPNYWIKTVVTYVESNENTASGDIATFTDGSGTPMTKCLVNLEPKQDLHGYDKPWSGGAGKNLVDISDQTFTQNVVITGLSLPAGSYRISAEITSSDTDFATSLALFRYNDNTFANSLQLSRAGRASAGVTFSKEVTALVLYASRDNSSSAGDTASWKNIMVESGSGSDSPFEPYENICPISGHDSVGVSVTGKNLFDGESYANREHLNWSENTLSGESVTGKTIWSNDFGYTGRITINCIPSAETVNNQSFLLQVVYTDGVRESIYPWGSGFPFTSNASKTVSSIMQSFGRLSMFSVSNIQIELGTTATTYEPYQSTDYTTQLPQTVYGGTVDLVSGRLVVDRAIVTLDGSQTNLGITTLQDFTQVAWSTYETVGAKVTDHLLFVSDKFESSYTYGLGLIYGSQGAPRMFLGLPTTITTRAEAMQWFADNPTTVVYELATPTTYQLTPQQVRSLLGTNNVWPENGTVEVKYIVLADQDIQIRLDNGLTSANATAATASDKADDAYEKADNAETIAQGAADDVAALETTYNTFIDTKAKYFVRNSAGSIVVAGISGINFNENNEETYGYNTLTAPSYISLRHNNINLARLSTGALTFYKPNGTKKTMELTNNALNFYVIDSNNTDTIAASLTGSGLNISKGSIQLGNQSNVDPTPGTAGFYVNNNGALYIGNEDQYIRFYDSNDSDSAPDVLEIKTPNFSVDANGNATFGGDVTALNLINLSENEKGTLTTAGFLYPFGYTETIGGISHLVRTYSVLVSNEEKGLYADSNGEFFTGTGSNYLALYERKDGDYNLDIVSQNLYLGAYDRPIEIVAEGLDNQINGKQLYSIDGSINEWQNFSIVQTEGGNTYSTIYADFDGTPVLRTEMNIATIDSISQAYVYTSQTTVGDATREDEDGTVLFTYEGGANKKRVYWTDATQTAWMTTQDNTGDYPYTVALDNINQYTDSLGRVVYAKNITRIDGEIPKGTYNFTTFEKNPQFFYQVTLQTTSHPYYDKNTPSRQLYSIDGTTNPTRIENNERVSNYTTTPGNFPLYLDIGLTFSNLPVTYTVTTGTTIIEYGALYSEDCTEDIGEFSTSSLPTNATGTQQTFTPLYRDGITGLPTLSTTDSSSEPNDYYYEQGLVNQINSLNTVLQQKDINSSNDTEWILSVGASNNEVQSLISITDKKISFQKNSQDLLFIAAIDNASDKQEGLSDYVNITKLNILDDLKLQDYYWKQLEDGSLILTTGE